METYTTGLHENIAESVGSFNSITVGVGDLLESQRVVEYALPFVAKLIFVVDDNLLIFFA